MDALEKLIQYKKSQPKGEFEKRINISLKNRYIYIAIGKAAHTAMQNALFFKELDNTAYACEHNNSKFPKVLGKVHPHPINTPTIKPFQLSERYLARILTSEKSNFFRFSVVRNPYHRFLSLYLHRFVRDARFKEKNISIEQFAEQVATEKPEKMNAHWRPQHIILRPDLVPYDFIGKFEDLQKDLEFIDENVNGEPISKYFKHVGVKTDSGKRLDLLTSTVIKIIDDVYSEDFRVFGYKKKI